jgi:hypothetical protein
MSGPAAIVEQYFAVVADLGTPRARWTRSWIGPFGSGRGTIREATGSLAAGTELVAHIAAWLTVVDGRIREHETFDCYEPLPT